MKVTGNKTHLYLDVYQAGTELMGILKGRLTLENCERGRNRLHSLLNPEIDYFYLYLGGLEYVDSAGWGTMVGLKMACNRNRTRLSFLAPTPRIMDVFRISKLDAIFEVKSGAEAELLREKLEKTEHLVWRETPDESQSKQNTETSFTPPQGKALAPGSSQQPQSGDDPVERLSRDAIEHLRHGDHEKVIEIYREILALNAEDVSALNNLAVVYEKHPQWRDKALQTWRQLLDLSERRRDAKHAERARRHLQLLEDANWESA